MSAPDDYERYMDEPRMTVEFGVNSGDPAKCCDPWFITDDEATAHETAQVIVDPFVMKRVAATLYGPWELVPTDEPSKPEIATPATERI